MALTELKRLVYSFPGSMGVYAKNLNTGQIVEVNANSPFYLASTSKIGILVGAFDALSVPSDLQRQIRFNLPDYRQEQRDFDHEVIGTRPRLEQVMRSMMRRSDAAATDMVVRETGIDNINKTIRNLNINGMGEITSIGYLDRYRLALQNPAWAALPIYAMSAYNRYRIPDYIYLYRNNIPSTSGKLFDDYRASGLNSATPRAMGQLVEKIALNQLWSGSDSWKNTSLLSVFGNGDDDLLSGVRETTKGGTHKGVKPRQRLMGYPTLRTKTKKDRRRYLDIDGLYGTARHYDQLTFDRQWGRRRSRYLAIYPWRRFYDQ